MILFLHPRRQVLIFERRATGFALATTRRHWAEAAGVSSSIVTAGGRLLRRVSITRPRW